MQVDPGYPLDSANVFNANNGHTAVLYDQAGNLKQNASDFGAQFTPIGNGSYSFPVSSPHMYHKSQTISVNDVQWCTWNSHFPNGSFKQSLICLSYHCFTEMPCAFVYLCLELASNLYDHG